MNNIITIFRKELKEILRDKRTLIIMLVLPLVVYPLLFTGVSSFMQGQAEKAGEETLRIGLGAGGDAALFREYLSAWPGKTDVRSISSDTAEAKVQIQADSLDVVFFFPDGFTASVDSLDPVSYTYYYTSTNKEFQVDMIRGISQGFQQSLTARKLAQLSVNERVLEPAQAEAHNIASNREQFGSIIGGIIPYFFIIFCLIGCMYPAMDIAAGEKERGTLETLLVSPASRLDIYLGKFMAVGLSGFISAMAAIAGILISSKMISAEAGAEASGIMEMMEGIIQPGSVLLLLGILLPLNAFFAAITLMLSIYARTYKEAQGMISPMMIVTVFPSVAGMLPGVTLNYVTALVPILNVSLGAKEIISGTAETGPLVVTYISLIAFALLALMASVRFFNQEKNIMRG
ncbi:MAG: ABC transporter permease [Chitinophagales bacterium]|nr:ABC transporter permease [Chitinophagales bacterium]HAE14467.1 hypothetical protein [Bacteroidota bacterium]MCB9022927.1 ABC transporter permease [Chitinophagales bacterium]HPE97787.1 ABC transporter permease [Chitinophagales bacterium]HQU38553.1 ABC transporter permease [Chitinophagales bacterium]